MIRFTIRDMLWLTVLAAVLLAWWIDRRYYSAKLEEVRHDLRTMIYRESSKISPFE